MRMIDNSEHFSRWLANHVTEYDDPENPLADSCGQSSYHIGSAKHRYESVHTPEAFFILANTPVLATASKITTMRTGRQEAELAAQTFQHADEEGILQTAMHCDATDEGLTLLRWNDTEQNCAS